jgi:hypothetical protein
MDFSHRFQIGFLLLALIYLFIFIQKARIM